MSKVNNLKIGDIVETAVLPNACGSKATSHVVLFSFVPYAKYLSIAYKPDHTYYPSTAAHYPWCITKETEHYISKIYPL